jgi:acyl-ACP thioesterase
VTERDAATGVLSEDGAAFTAPYRVRFDEAGPEGSLRTSGLLRYAQDVAWLHSDVRGFTRSWYAERGVSWVVRAAAIEVLEPVPMGSTLAVTTRVIGFHRIWAQRRADCLLPNGRLAAAVRTDWVLIDGRGRLVRVPAELVERFASPAVEGSVLRVPLPPTPAAAGRRSFTVRRQELDPMNHPNNAAYLDWLEESLAQAGDAAVAAAGARPRTIRLEYAAAPGPGDPVESAAWHDGGRWCWRLTDSTGSDLLRADLQPAHLG